ncbi:MAG TPA: GFA family protein [Rhodanobacteraceae bacterium]
MHSGSCLCGSITYTLDGEPGTLTFCHCTRCQKANGTAFLAAAEIDRATFHLDDPSNYLKAFESSPNVFRHFCGNCGSPLFSRRPGPPEILRLRVGTLDTTLTKPLDAQIYYANKAPWYHPDDTSPRFFQGFDSEQI